MNNMSLRGGRTSQCSSLPLSKVSLLDEGILLKRRLLRTPALVRLKPHGARGERSQRHMRWELLQALRLHYVRLSAKVPLQ